MDGKVHVQHADRPFTRIAMQYIRFLAVVVIASGLWAVSAFAQIGQANLHGVVRDASKALIPGATVTLKNTGTGAVRSVTTGPSGAYTIPSLAPGDYSLTVQFRGFKEFVISSMTLHTGQSATVNATLQVGAARQQVVVKSEVPLLTTTSAAVQHLVTPTEVAHLPLNGRQFWQLTQLTPGSTYIPRGQLSQFNGSEIRARSVNVTTNGQSSIFTGWTLDGALVTNMELGGTLIQPNVDALQEFSVKAGNMSAAYGHSPNMIVATLKSGTNSFHGSVFEYLRNDVLDARNFFLPDRLALKQNQFGFSLGGPILRNRLFFFADYQGTRVRKGTPFNVVVPSPPEREGDFSSLLPKQIKNPLTGQAFSGNRIIPSTLITSQARFLLQYMPLPNATQGTTSRFLYGPSTSLNNDEGDIKIDANLTSKDSLMARYSINHNDEFDPLPFPKMIGTDLTSKAQDETIRLTHIFSPNLLNVAQVAVYSSPFLFGAVLPGTNINGMAGIQGFSDPKLVPLQSFPRITISGYQQYQGSPSDQRPKHIWVRSWQYMDSVHYTKGRHAMDFGMEWLHRLDTFGVGGGQAVGHFNFTGNYSGNSFADFLLGYPHDVTRTAYLPVQGNYDSFPAWYFNDVYQVKQGLTLNLGLRFQVDPWFKGVNYAASAFSPDVGKLILPAGLQLDPNASPLVSTLTPLFSDRILYSSQVGLPPQLHPTSHDWNPRVGLAWRPFGSQKMVIRSSYGIYYVFPDTNLTNNTKNVVPLQDVQQTFNSTPIPTRTFADFFQGETIGSANPNPGQPCPFGMVMLSCETPNVTSEPVNQSQQYTQEWNLSVQRQLTKGVSMTLAYVGNRTVHLQQGIPTNIPDPAAGSIQLRRPLPQWGVIHMQEWGGKANYNALQAEIDSRQWHGLSLIGAYTYSKCMDNGSNEGGPPAQQLLSTMYAVCNYDQTQAASMSYYYRLPFGRGQRFLGGSSAIVNQALGGWQLGGILTLQSGLPYTPTISGDRANTGAGKQRPDLVGSPMVTGNVGCWFYVSSNSICRSLFPNAQDAFALPAKYTYGNSGRNILRSDGLAVWNFSLMKNFQIRESMHLQFRTEAFNFLNQPTFAAPATNINVGSGGEVSSTLNSNRIFQFALKLIF